jgi:hypothetical protein
MIASFEELMDLQGIRSACFGNIPSAVFRKMGRTREIKNIWEMISVVQTRDDVQ